MVFVVPFKTAGLCDAPALQPHPKVLIKTCELLRVNHYFWKEITQHLPASAGSLATVIIVLIDEQNVPHILTQPGTGPAPIHKSMREQLMKNGLASRPSTAMADSVVRHVYTVNAKTVTMCRTMVHHSTSHVVVLRVALKSVRQIDINPSTQNVWFKNGHANVVVINTMTKTAVFLEPVGKELVKNLERLLMQLLVPSTEFKLLHNLSATAFSGLQVTDDNMCTIWCAIFAMVVLANPENVSRTFASFLQWVTENKTQFLKYFFQHTRPVVHQLMDP
jgi:hypothetical protein